MIKRLKFFAAGLCLALVFSIKGFGAGGPVEVEGVVTKDASWSGEVLVVGDVLVPEGVTLIIGPGAKVMFAASESSKIEPMFLSMQTELLVRGTLVVMGERNNTVSFGPAPEGLSGKRPERGDWGGLIFDGPGASDSVIAHAGISKADTAVAAYGASPAVLECLIDDSRYGVVCVGGSRPKLTGSTVTGCEFGIVASQGGKPVIEGSKVEKNERDFLIKE